MKNNEERFILDLLDKKVFTEDEVKRVFNVRFVDRFVNKICKRTGLDIRQFESIDGDYYYFLVSDIVPEAPGLSDMSVPVEYDMLTEFNPEVHYNKGYYAMWVCPTPMTTEQTDEDNVGLVLCGQFHKTDLGDEPLTKSKSVECIKCGRRYQIKPR